MLQGTGRKQHNPRHDAKEKRTRRRKKKKKKGEEERKVKHITTETKNRLESFSRKNETGTRREGIGLLWGVGVPGLKRKEKKE